MAKKLAFIFPGQGSQFVGMGKDLYENSEAARKVIDTADKVLGFPLSKLMFEGPEEELTLTVNTQPALLTASVAALEELRSRGVKASFAAGHSVGEYAALVCAGALTFPDALKLVRRRGELMYEAGQASDGTMAAIIGLGEDDVRAAVQEAQPAGIVDVANYNSPVQTVVTGAPDAVAEAGRLAKEKGAKRVLSLKVSGAFHSRLMAPAAKAMRGELEHVTITDPATPIVANFTADYVKTGEEVREALAEQVQGSVRWVESIKRIAADGADIFVEAGSGTVLAGLVVRIVDGAQTASVGDTASADAFVQTLD